MARELLSQAELDTLLAPRDGRPANPLSARDLHRPDPARGESHRTLAAMQQGIGQGWAAALSTLLRARVEIKLSSIDEATYARFIAGLGQPTCLNVLRAGPLAERAAVDLPLSIVYPIIDRMLGGGREPSSVTTRPLTEIESRLVSRASGLLIDELRAAWQGVLDGELALDRMESDPRRAPLGPAEGAVAIVRFELSIGEDRGMMALCVPSAIVERYSQRANSSLGHKMSVDGAGEPVAMEEHARGPTVELVARLAETKISAGEIVNLRVGDIIATEKDVRGPVDVCVDGVTKFRAIPGALGGRKVVRIDDVLDRPERDESQS